MLFGGHEHTLLGAFMELACWLQWWVVFSASCELSVASGPVPIGAEKLSGGVAVKVNSTVGFFRTCAGCTASLGVWGGVWWGTSLRCGKPSHLLPVVLTLDSALTQFFTIWGMFYHKIPGLKQESYSAAEIWCIFSMTCKYLIESKVNNVYIWKSQCKYLIGLSTTGKPGTECAWSWGQDQWQAGAMSVEVEG